MTAPIPTVASKASKTPYQLDLDQVQRAADALLRTLKKTQSELATKTNKQSLIPTDASDDEGDSTQEPVWLIVTTKKHVVDKKRLKPNKIQIPHSLHSVSATATNPTRICLITADPQRIYKDIVASDAIPSHLKPCISRVIGISKLKAKYKSYEAKRQLHGEYDIFLADDRIVTSLPETLGKIFYKGGEKRPIPVELAGNKKGRTLNEKDSLGMKKKRQGEDAKLPLNVGSAEFVAKEIEKAINAALVHLSPSVTTAVKVAHSGMSANAVRENITAVCNGMVEKFVPQGWRNVRAMHIKGPNSMAVPIWLASELWVDEQDVLDEPFKPSVTAEEKKALKASKRKLLADGSANAAAEKQDESPQKKRRADRADSGVEEKPAKKSKQLESDAPSRKSSLKKLKAQAMAVTAH